MKENALYAFGGAFVGSIIGELTTPDPFNNIPVWLTVWLLTGMVLFAVLSLVDALFNGFGPRDV